MVVGGGCGGLGRWMNFADSLDNSAHLLSSFVVVVGSLSFGPWLLTGRQVVFGNSSVLFSALCK